ncbi:MAG: hypothetical protein ACE5I3_07460 [Phycisphaerae bacterium]
MDARVRNRVLWVGLPLVVLLSGCGNYTITFEVADVINAWGADITGEMLDVDIVCLSKKDAENHPEIVQKTMRANEWFEARDKDAARIGDIPAKRIYAFRWGKAGDKRDTLVGPPLLAARQRDDGLRTTAVRVHHSQFTSGKSAIVIYGRFNSQAGIAKTPPLVIQPPPRWDTDIKIHVGRRDMRRVD